ncbi:MAG: VIT1/CCC1 transporter family protein [Patescibacteria group bacterium]
MLRKFHESDIVRNVVFGVEDSLVSTVGLVSGIASAGIARETILMTGVVLVVVEAFSMAVGALLSENAVEEAEVHREVSLKGSVVGALTMFLSYLVAGTLVIIPYLIAPTETAFVASVVISLLALFLLGLVSAGISKIHPVKKGIMMVLIGGCAIGVGILVGRAF